ncbi:MAG: MBL fold metallo-hydrolase [Acidobacteriota bacterium]
MRITFLGTGTSRGIPTVGCQCKVCRSTNPRNKRLRASLLIESEVNVVIDTSVDFRTQMLRHNVTKLDAVVYTHCHVDHILGLDDVYPFNMWSGETTQAYGSPATLEEIQMTFRHLFRGELYPGVPGLELVPIDGNFDIGNLKFEPLEVLHGQMPVLGFRVGRFAYITDVSHIPEKAFQQLKGIDYLALGGLRYLTHHKHFSLSEATAVAQQIGARETFLIHMNHDVDHDEGNASLPESVSLAYDGLSLEID